jgi:hypothetical protein
MRPSLVVLVVAVPTRFLRPEGPVPLIKVMPVELVAVQVIVVVVAVEPVNLDIQRRQAERVATE